MSSRTRYSEQDDNCILKNIQLYPDNLLHAFQKSSEELINRSAVNIRARYYQVLKHREDFKAVTCGSKEGFTHNVKNNIRIEGQFPEDRSLNSVEWLMKQFLDLPKSDRDKIFNFFISTGSINVASPVVKGKKNNINSKNK